MTDLSDKKTILIAGAGIAGPALALPLSKLGHKCTIVERSPQWRTSGQQIDVSDEALKVIDFLGVSDAIWAKRVEDHGLKFVNEKNGVVAEFPLSKGGGIVKELEILRPDLANVFYERTKDSVEYVFDDHITGMHQHDNGVTVTFANSNETRDFNLVVAADGLRSKTRRIAFDDSNTKIVELGQYAGYFDIEWQEHDGMWSRWFNDTAGRAIALRPNKENGTTSAYLAQVTDDAARLASLPLDEQRKDVTRIFGDVGWEVPRVLEALNSERGEKFYLAETAQAKSTSLSNGRVALLGDAGYCPSPITGQGTTLALIGAYILAGCVATYSDYREALSQYEKMVKPFVENSQKIPPGAPWIVCPQSATGISVLNSVLWVVGQGLNSVVGTVLGKVAAPIGKLFPGGPKLPDFPALRPAAGEKLTSEK